MIGLQRVAQPQVVVEPVGVAASDALARNVPGLREVMEDRLHCTLGDAHRPGDFADPRIGIAMDVDEHVTVVGEECPLAGGRGVLSVHGVMVAHI